MKDSEFTIDDFNRILRPDHESRARSLVVEVGVLMKNLGALSQDEIKQLPPDKVYFGIDIALDIDIWLDPDFMKIAMNLLDSGYLEDVLHGEDLLSRIEALEHKSADETNVNIFIAGPDYGQVDIALREIKGLIYKYKGIWDNWNVPNEDLIDCYEDEDGEPMCYKVEFDVIFRELSSI